ncbi:MAG: hypothetical protein QM706_11590 [Nitrospira sp.]
MELLTSEEMKHADEILHDHFPQHVEKDLHQHQGPGVVTSNATLWTITDRRTGRAMYGHA